MLSGSLAVSRFGFSSASVTHETPKNAPTWPNIYDSLLDHISPDVIDALGLVRPHLILVSDGTDVTYIVGLLQRTITID